MPETDVVILDVVRTPIGRPHGALAGWHPAELGAETLRALVVRNGLDPTLVDRVVFGCVSQVGAQTYNLARAAVLAAGWPEATPATTLDSGEGAGLEAVHTAIALVGSGMAGVTVGGGVESASTVPTGASAKGGTFGTPFGEAVFRRFDSDGGLVPPGVATEHLAESHDLTRAELDGWAAASHQRAARADAQAPRGDVVAVRRRQRDRESGRVVESDGRLETDEAAQSAMDVDTLTELAPAFVDDGCVTAGNSAPAGDGAAVALIASREIATGLAIAPRAQVRATCLVGDDQLGLRAITTATEQVLDRAGLNPSDIDRFGVDESSAALALAWLADVKADPERVNVDGGATARGRPLGAAGSITLVDLVGALEQSDGRWGLCVSGGSGQASATIIERAR